jgi:mono/diheme cytochrome c family protein
MNRLATFAGAIAIVAAGSIARAEDKVDFGKQIVPILKENCFKCHGAEKQKAKLALHTPEAITKGSKEGPVVVKGDPSKSSLYTRVILPPKDEDIMPPEDEGKPLTKEQTALIEAWIKQGADFGGWKGETAGAGGAAAPKEAPLPVVPAADAGAIDKLKGNGALVLPLAQGINLLDVSFIGGADKVTDAELANLAPLSAQVYALNLAGTKVTDSGLAALAKLPNLRILHLEKTGVGDAGLAHVKSLATLEYLNLYGTQVTDAGLAQLEGMKNLKHVYLWQSKVTDAGADKLRKALPAAKVDNGWKEASPAAAAK